VRLKIEIVTLVHTHAEMLVLYLALLIGLGFGLATVGMTRALRDRYIVLIVLVCAQGLVGIVQYFTHVPAALVAVHVGGAAACTAATAALWAAMRTRERITAENPAPVAQSA
jgi:cytochrome c oxidase assembly protein subunit 15